MDTIDRAARSRLMSRIRGKDTGPEMIVRRLAHRMGFRFRLHRRDLPGSPDLVFPGLRKVVFVHGCHEGERRRLRHRLTEEPGKGDDRDHEVRQVHEPAEPKPTKTMDGRTGHGDSGRRDDTRHYAPAPRFPRNLFRPQHQRRKERRLVRDRVASRRV